MTYPSRRREAEIHADRIATLTAEITRLRADRNEVIRECAAVAAKAEDNAMESCPPNGRVASAAAAIKSGILALMEKEQSMQPHERQARRWAVSKFRDENPSDKDIDDSYDGKFDNNPAYTALLERYLPRAASYVGARTGAYAPYRRELKIAETRMGGPRLVG